MTPDSIARFLLLVALAFSTGVKARQTSDVSVLSITAPNGQVSVLVGSVHVGIPGLREPSGSIFKNAKRLVLEHVGVPQHGDVGIAGVRAEWARELADGEIREYLRRARCAFLGDADALAFLNRPSVQWANQIAYRVCSGVPVESRDQIILKAKPNEVPIDVLESDAEVEAMRLALPAEVARSAFRWILAHDPATVLDGIATALNAGNYDSIKAQVEDSIGDVDLARVQSRIMVDERNAAWMPRLCRYLDEGRAVVLVGAMHLPGPNGLIQKLRRSGYVVRAVNLPAADTQDSET